MKIRNNSVSIETKLWVEQPVFDSQQGQYWDFFFFAMASRPALGTTQPPVRWVHFHLVPRLRIGGAVSPL
jgi:hypothetical protein